MLITLVWKSWSSDITLNRWPVFIFNVTKAVVLNTFFTAKGRISMLWGFSHIFSCQIFVSLIFCVLTTLFQMSSNLKTNYSNYKRCEVPKSFLINCEPSVILVGSKIWGKIKLDPRVSRKIEDSGSSGILSKFTLKSPRRISCLFSEPSLWISGLRKSELNEFRDIPVNSQNCCKVTPPYSNCSRTRNHLLKLALTSEAWTFYYPFNQDWSIK